MKNNSIEYKDIEEFKDDILNKTKSLTKSQRRVAHYLINHYEKSVFMNAYEIGREANVSESTVVRFAYALGFDGYPSLRNTLQDILKGKLTTVNRMSHGKEDPLPYHAMQIDMENIHLAIKNNPIEKINEVSDSFLNAKRIALIAFRSAKALSYYLKFNLNLLLPSVEIIDTNYDDIYSQLLKLDENDVVLAISLNRYPKITVECFEFAKRQNAKTIALTDSLLSPLNAHADITLLSPGSLVGFVDSYVSSMSLIRAILLCIGQINSNNTNELLNKLETTWGIKGIYNE